MFRTFDRIAYAARIVQVRRETNGDAGLELFADSLRIPVNSWANYEDGVVMPDHILLRFLSLTGVTPLWLLTGEGGTSGDHPKPIIQVG